MGSAFSAPDDEALLRDFRREVAAHRSVGSVRVEFRRVSGAEGAPATSVATEFVATLALRAPDRWTELDAREALEAATRILHLDLAYSGPVMKVEVAKGLAARFLECCGKGAVFFTNGALTLTGTGAWSPLTDATFDAGIVGVASGRVGLLWVEDED
jgi:hypothetical protein